MFATFESIETDKKAESCFLLSFLFIFPLFCFNTTGYKNNLCFPFSSFGFQNPFTKSLVFNKLVVFFSVPFLAEFSRNGNGKTKNMGTDTDKFNPQAPLLDIYKFPKKKTGATLES